MVAAARAAVAEGRDGVGKCKIGRNSHAADCMVGKGIASSACLARNCMHEPSIVSVFKKMQNVVRREESHQSPSVVQFLTWHVIHILLRLN